MDRSTYIRAAALYVPVVAALGSGLVGKQPRRQFAACLLSFLWVLPMLVVLQRLNEWAGWWTYSTAGVSFSGMPLELYLGWVVLWGLLPQMVLWRVPVWLSAWVMVAVDLVAMPLCAPVVVLGPHWLVGEAIAVALVLIPALLIARWTLADSHLGWRGAVQVATSGLLFLYLVPELVFAVRPGAGWGVLFAMPSWERQVRLQIVALCSIPGLTGVVEFVQRGGGTPIPYDPPKRLVASGIYRYVANPMQLACTVTMTLWAGMLRNVWLLIPAGIALVYSAGIADWDEGADLAERFGAPWRAYRREVRNWWPRWRPYCGDGVAKVYISRDCGPCSEVRRWIVARKPLGMEIVDAETLPAGSIERMRYVSADGSYRADGVRAMARVMEHLNLGWALVGAAGRLPGVWWVTQTILDRCGLGPRSVGCDIASHRMAEEQAVDHAEREDLKLNPEDIRLRGGRLRRSW